MMREVRSIRPVSVAAPVALVCFVMGCVSVLVLVIGTAMAPGPIVQVRLGGPLALGFQGMPRRPPTFE